MLKRLIIVIFATVFVVEAFWLWGIPDRWVQQKIKASFSVSTDYHLLDIDLEGLHKAIPFRFSVKKIVFSYKGKEILTLNDVTGNFNPFSVLIQKLGLSVKGTISEGSFSSNIILDKRQGTVNFTIKDVEIEGLEIIKLFGIGGKGKLNGSGSIEIDPAADKSHSLSGYLNLRVENLKIRDLRCNETYLPMSLFNELRCAVEPKGRSLILHTVLLTGPDVHGILRGKSSGRHVEGTLEIFTSENNSFENLRRLAHYRVTPSYYLIPLSCRPTAWEQPSD